MSLDSWIVKSKGEQSSSFQSIAAAANSASASVTVKKPMVSATVSVVSVQPPISAHVPPVQSGSSAIVCFTDGSSIGNGGAEHLRKAGYACVFPDFPTRTLAARLRGEKTNNRAELMAVISAFDIADKIDPGKTTPLMVYTDSELVINSVMKWMSGWKRHGWRKSDGKTIMNKDLIMMLDERKALRPVSMKHVRAHTGRSDWESMWNDAADKLARKAAES